MQAAWGNKEEKVSGSLKACLIMTDMCMTELGRYRKQLLLLFFDFDRSAEEYFITMIIIIIIIKKEHSKNKKLGSSLFSFLNRMCFSF